MIYTYVLLTFLPQTTSPLMAFALTAVGYVILTGYTSVNAIVKAELFPADIRALGVGLGYALANSVFGGTAPLLFQAAKSADHVTWFIVYVTVVIGVSLLVYIFGLKNKGMTVLDREQGSAWAGLFLRLPLSRPRSQTRASTNTTRTGSGTRRMRCF